MKKFHSLIILFIAIVLSGCAVDKNASQISKSIDSVNETPLPVEGFTPLIDDKGGVEVTIENVSRDNDQTSIDLTLSNHVYDLASFDLKNLSSLSGVTPTTYIIKNSAMGGHHIEAEMVFDGELSGPLVVYLDDSLIFNFNIQ